LYNICSNAGLQVHGHNLSWYQQNNTNYLAGIVAGAGTGNAVNLSGFYGTKLTSNSGEVVVLEATGYYSDLATSTLHSAGLQVHLVNPRFQLAPFGAHATDVKAILRTM